MPEVCEAASRQGLGLAVWHLLLGRVTGSCLSISYHRISSPKRVGHVAGHKEDHSG